LEVDFRISCVLVLPVGKLLIVKLEIKSPVENVIETVQLVVLVLSSLYFMYIHNLCVCVYVCGCVFFVVYGLGHIIVVISEHVFQTIVSVDVCMGCR